MSILTNCCRYWQCNYLDVTIQVTIVANVGIFQIFDATVLKKSDGFSQSIRLLCGWYLFSSRKEPPNWAFSLVSLLKVTIPFNGARTCNIIYVHNLIVLINVRTSHTWHRISVICDRWIPGMVWYIDADDEIKLCDTFRLQSSIYFIERISCKIKLRADSHPLK